MVDYSKWDKIDYDESDNEGETQQATPTISIADNFAVSEDDKPLVELMQHVQSMDCNEAHKQMCLAQDEIKRLKQLQVVEGTDITLSTTQQLSVSSKDTLQSETSDKMSQLNESIPRAAQVESTINPRNNDQMLREICGSWLDGQDDSTKLCSIEYLPNVKCYQITLLTNNTEDVPQFKEELQFDMISIANNQVNNQSVIPTVMSYYEAKLHRLELNGDKERQLLLSVTLPISSTSNESPPTARISLDTNSISIRVQQDLLSMVEMDDSFGIVDNLLGIELSSFASVTTNPNDLNYLHCRTCQNPIIEPPSSAAASSNDNTIQSVLPLPTGYWDDISDYLICYDGQAIVDFTSPTTTAIKQSALEDDAVLVLHKDDLIQNQQRRGIRIGRVKGYGEHSSGIEDASSSEAWKDKAAIKGGKSKIITCAKCCSTLGFVSNNDNDSNTYRLYKHLLDCGKPPNTSIFSKYTCGSFLAREMIRYAENDAIYTFIVGISDEMDWTRAHNPGPCILIRMLSWDTPMAVVDKKSSTDESNKLQFHKVVKIIFEEVSDKVIDTTNNNDSMEWTWRGVDFCCPPPNGTNVDESTEMQTKASSIRIFFSQHEWAELKDTLIDRSMCFSEAVKEAVVMTKLGLPTSDEEQKAALSFLSLVL